MVLIYSRNILYILELNPKKKKKKKNTKMSAETNAGW